MAESIVVYYNPRCSKCRQAKALLDDRGVSYLLRTYLDQPPDRTELEALLQKLGTDDPAVMLRSKEPAFAQAGLAGADRDRRLDAIAEHPELLERPIVVAGEQAVVARPPEKLLDLL